MERPSSGIKKYILLTFIALLEEAGGGGGAGGYCSARWVLGELPDGQAKLGELIRRRCGGGGVLTTSVAVAEEAADGARAGGCGRA